MSYDPIYYITFSLVPHIPPDSIVTAVCIRIRLFGTLRRTYASVRKVTRLVQPAPPSVSPFCTSVDRGSATYFPVLGLISPPSDRGMSRLLPAPEAAEPYVTSAPGNLFSTEESTPDSVAVVPCQHLRPRANYRRDVCVLESEPL